MGKFKYKSSPPNKIFDDLINNNDYFTDEQLKQLQEYFDKISMSRSKNFIIVSPNVADELDEIFNDNKNLESKKIIENSDFIISINKKPT